MTETVYSNGVVLRRIKVGDTELSALYDKDGQEFDSCETRDEAKMLDHYRHQWNEPNLPLDHVDVCVEGAENLVHAIVRQAANDYRMLKHCDDNNMEKKDIEKFFLSDYFEALTGFSGRMILAKLKLAGQCIKCPLYDKREGVCSVMYSKTFLQEPFDVTMTRHSKCPLINRRR